MPSAEHAGAERFQPRAYKRKLGALVVAATLLSGCARSEAAANWGLVSDEGTLLEIEVVVGDSMCHSLGNVSATESDDQIVITATVIKERRIGFGCNADLVTEFVELVLEEPLGTRSLLGCNPAGDSYFREQANGGCRAIVADD